MAYAVSRRTREIGIRMAIGANPADVLKSVLRRGLLLAGCGVSVGMLGSLAVRKAMQAAYGVHSTDPIALIGAPVALLLVMLLATLVPAVRASRIAPAQALRYE